ncbi:ATP-binding protein [Clostridium sp. AM58-1XD]|uniref:ATP-binding protein n=1 Tax=Clostridium sp. AM58-1XD TaxID=2292307 RepID=UPI000E4E42EF|nr:ATP-binding protein [Clostridium sp. AM58-1XD]RGZ00192.1 AAA family ATPase [Clostridium sp. AM58-1XD]
MRVKTLEEAVSRIQAERTAQTIILETPEQTSRDSDVCPICQGKGWIYWVDEAGRDYGRRCDCGLVERQIMERKLSFANIPEAFKEMSLKTFQLGVYHQEDSRRIIKQTCAAIKYYMDHLEDMRAKGMGLYLYSGTKGSGKTRMAASIANELIYTHRLQVKFAGSMQIVNEIKSTWDDKSKSESNLLSALSSVQVLVIDDFGTELPKDWIGERFYSIINGRYQDRVITIFTSNMNLEDLKYDDRITNRIKERTFQLPFPEESVRELIADENRKSLIEGMNQK